MELSIYRKKWLSIKKDSCLQDALLRFSRQVALSFVDRYYQTGAFEPGYITLLCEMATSFPDTELNNPAASALFEIIVEKLCDDFEDVPVEVYCRVMSEVISYCRNARQGASLDRAMADFGILSPEHLYERAIFVHTHRYSYNSTNPPGKIVLLSRVTIGADVAILSVMIQRFTRIFPQAEIVVIGSSKLQGVFGGNKHIRICPLDYARSGGLFERFSSWHSALDILADEMPPGQEDRTLLVDPDSRISQLGVLPLTHRDNYLFFNSRQCAASARDARMAELANRWMDSVFGVSEFCYPEVWTIPSISLKTRKLAALLRSAGCKQLVAVNFGVGTNPRKRLGLDFEQNLLREILNAPQTVVLLDKGFGQDELSRSAALLDSIKNRGVSTADMSFDDPEYPIFSHGLLTIGCSVGEIAALIAQCDEFIGYDSACQHIAAAVRTPAVTIFAGSNDMNFVRRWSACGKTQHKIVHVDTFTDPQNVNTSEVISRIMAERPKKQDRRQKPALSEAEGTGFRILDTDLGLPKPVRDLKKQTL